MEASGALILLEAGLGVWPELLRHNDPARLAAIWVSHLHPDHCGDLFAAYQWAANTPDAPRISVFGPPGWAERIGAALPACDGAARLRRLFNVREHTAHTEEVAGVAFTPVPVRHSVPTFGLRLSHRGWMLAYSGDSGPFGGLRELANGADVFLCEAGAIHPGQPFHCAPEDAARAAAGAHRLILTHLAPGLDPTDAARRAGGADVAAMLPMLDIS